MTRHPARVRRARPAALAAIAALGAAAAAPGRPAPTRPPAEPRPLVLVVAGDIPPARRDAMLAAARRFYRFWDTGDEGDLRRALSPAFVDRTLPPGRPQGVPGPLAASAAFRAAAPDLRVTVRQQILAGDRVVSHLHFAGHFTGRFQGVAGRGQALSFIATDILRVRDGRITDNWHLEDNLTLLRQMGLVAAPAGPPAAARPSVRAPTHPSRSRRAE